MTWSGEVDPPHARRAIINEEGVERGLAVPCASRQACLSHHLPSLRPVKVIVTVSGNYNRLDQSSFVEGSDECITGDTEWLCGGVRVWEGVVAWLVTEGVSRWTCELACGPSDAQVHLRHCFVFFMASASVWARASMTSTHVVQICCVFIKH